MSRKSEFQAENNNPCKKYMEWKSNDKKFSYYDKEQSKNILVDLPLKFVTLFEFHGVRGWNDASESGIYSNEVKYIGKEELSVKSFKGGAIATGLYKDIKSKVQGAGGNYCKILYVMFESKEIACIMLKGSAVKEWGDFTQKNRMRLPDEWVLISGAKDMKKGSVKYSVPTFEFDKQLSDDEVLIADDVYNTLNDYRNSKDDAPAESEEEIVEDLVDEDVPF